MGEFADKVFDVVSHVPCGKVVTYGQVAKLMGHPRSARYVGFALRTNPRPGVDADSIPCHRVIFSDGSLCKGFAFGGPDVQYRRLLDEGVEFRIAKSGSEEETLLVHIEGKDEPVSLDSIRVDLKRSQWDGKGYGQPVPEGEPTAPPEDFDWEAEMGE